MAKIEKVDGYVCPDCNGIFELEDIENCDAYKCPHCGDIYSSKEEALFCCK